MLRSKLLLSQLEQKDYKLTALVELFHLTTLIQDDVIDNALFRRYVPTLNSIYNKRQAIIISDLLLIDVVEQIDEIFTNKYSQNIAGTEIIEFLKLKTNQFIGELIESELIESELNAVKIQSIKDYEKYAKGKTAKFFGIMILIGQLINQENNIDKLMNGFDIGVRFGIIFQKIDDLIDFKDDFEKNGKIVVILKMV